MHTTYGIDTWRTKTSVQGQQKLEKLLCNKIAIIVDKMSIISLEFLATVDLHFGRTKFLYENLYAVLSRFSDVILLGGFFQFSPVTRQSLWKVPLSPHKKHRQRIWHHFADIITLTK